MKNLTFCILALFIFNSLVFSQIKLPNTGERFEFNNSESTLPSAFDLSNADSTPYTFSYNSLGEDVLNFKLIKDEDRISLGFEDAKSAVFNFYNEGKLVGSLTGDNIPTSQVAGGPGPLVIVAIVVAACCIKVKYKKTTTSGNPPVTTSTWEFGWDCNCSLFEKSNKKGSILVNGEEILFDNFTIDFQKNSDVKDLSLILAH